MEPACLCLYGAKMPGSIRNCLHSWQTRCLMPGVISSLTSADSKIITSSDITPLDKLSFIGKRGMGALEFQPEYARERKAEKIDMKSLTELAERIYTEREQVHILPEESITMQSLLTVGTSAGGQASWNHPHRCRPVCP